MNSNYVYIILFCIEILIGHIVTSFSRHITKAFENVIVISLTTPKGYVLYRIPVVV